ncbi:hypothetical protein F0562_029554 [Nyssa sinensis]|uniref:AP2/ERF domain-containing protein n=1 Tax=Nyssa sinensis TaxID=561372 RepID=A0A5J5B4D4_9ASTE|nr:hypothetical protein F0562_029554 [Nyssa sinensis]
MKRSPSSSCSSSSSSCVESHLGDHRQSAKPKTTKPARAKKNLNPEKCKINAQSSNSCRRSSIYRGVTRHRWTGRYEAHLWDKSTWNSIQKKRGRQIYLGAYDNEEAAAHTYDLAALKYWGPNTTLNFPIDTYTEEFEQMQKLSKEEYLALLRRHSSGFSRGVSKYRGVARHHHNGRWEARIGRVYGNKYLYLGTYNTQEEAAVAYDMAAIEHRGANAVTNFDIRSYAGWLKKKGILVEDQPQQLNNANSSIATPVHENQEEEEQQQQMVEEHEDEHQLIVQQLVNLEPPPAPIDLPHSMVVMDPADEHEHPWSLCLYTEFNPLLVPDIPLENAGELPDLFDDRCFEEDIDFIFDEPASSESEFNLSDMLDFDSISCGVEPDVLVGFEQKGQEVLTSSSSQAPSPLSLSSSSSPIPTTLVSCN